MLRKRTITVYFDEDYSPVRKRIIKDCLSRFEAPLIHTLPPGVTDDPEDESQEESELWQAWFPVAEVIAVYCDSKELNESDLLKVYRFDKQGVTAEFRIFSKDDIVSYDLDVSEYNNIWQVNIYELNICEQGNSIVEAINKVKHALSLPSD